MSILIDPGYLGFRLCTCISGTYPWPAPPTCLTIPDVTRGSLPSDSLSQDTTDLDSLQQWRLLNNDTASQVLTDASFGEQRSVAGMNTKWLINATARTNDSVPPVVSVFLVVDLDVFVGGANILSVFAGSSTQGDLQFTLAGDDASLLAAGQAAAAAAATTASFFPSVCSPCRVRNTGVAPFGHPPVSVARHTRTTFCRAPRFLCRVPAILCANRAICRARQRPALESALVRTDSFLQRVRRSVDRVCMRRVQRFALHELPLWRRLFEWYF